MISKQLLIVESVSDEIKSWVSQNGFEVVGNLWDTEESNVFGFNTEDPQVDVYMDVSDDSSEVHVVLAKEGVAVDRKVFNMSKTASNSYMDRVKQDAIEMIEKVKSSNRYIDVSDLCHVYADYFFEEFGSDKVLNNSPSVEKVKTWMEESDNDDEMDAAYWSYIADLDNAIKAEGFTVEDMHKIVEKFDKKAQDIPVADNKFDRGERLMEIWKEHVGDGIPLEFTTRGEVIEWCEDNFGNSAVIGKNGEGILCYMEFGSALVISEYEGEPWLVNVSMFDKKKGSRKHSHSLWNATKDNDGNVLVHRTQAERENFDDVEFVEAKVANSLGLWGAALTDINDFQKLPTSIRDRFSLVASEMKKEGEAPPKVMSWSELNSAFSPENVESVKRKVVFGMKVRQASKNLDIPFIMAADLLEDYEKIGKKAMKDVVASVKQSFSFGQSVRDLLGLDVEYSVEDDLSGLYENNGSGVGQSVKDFFGLNQSYYSDEFSPEQLNASNEMSKNLLFNIMNDSSLSDLVQSYWDQSNEDKKVFMDFLKNDQTLKSYYGNNVILDPSWATLVNTLLDPYNNVVASVNKQAAKYGKVAEKVANVLSSSCPKVAVDSKAEEYWKAYYGPYGEQLVKEVKKRIKADLAKIWLTKQGVDEAAAEYWQNYFTDENYGEELTKDIPKRLSPKANRKKSNNRCPF